MGKRDGFTLVEMLIVLGIILLSMAIAMPMLGNFVQGSVIDRAADVLGSALTAARSVAVSRHKFVAVRLDADGDVRLYLWPQKLESDDPEIPPVGVEDSDSTGSDDERQKYWHSVEGVRSWRIFEGAVVINAEDPWRDGRPNQVCVILIAPNGMVMDGVRVSPRGHIDKQSGSPYERDISIVRMRIFQRADFEDHRNDQDYFTAGDQGRVLYIDRITAQILNVPGGDEMIRDPQWYVDE